uniref:Radial spoke head protein 3 homolog n=1 Tax=Glossina brevipalpis TaxID=37001 RepID=A0A1A9WK18_9MUSC
MPTVPPSSTFGRGKKPPFLIDDQSKEKDRKLTKLTGIHINLEEGCPAPPCQLPFWWSSVPQAKNKKTSKGRKETPLPEPYKNVMYDSRVVKGPNYGVSSHLVEYQPLSKFAEAKKRLTLRKNFTCGKNLRNVLGTPPPVHGRHHEIVQTDKYLEELVSHPAEFDAETQTDLFLEKPAQPPYTPAKVGIDVGTEIGEGELFHFDAEAQPIIEVMVDGTIELTVLEVAHEREMETIRRRQDELLAQREAELAELRRLEDEEIRLRAEKERRIRQDAIAKSMDDEIQKEVIAAKILQGHIASILPEILDNLEPATDATKRQKLIDSLCPWLAKGVSDEVGKIVDCREVLKNIIKEIVKKRAEIYAGYHEETPTLQISYEGEHEECEIELSKEETESDSCPPETSPSERSGKGCCGQWFAGPPLRALIAVVALGGVACALAGAGVGFTGVAGPPNSHLTAALLMIGVGVVLVTVSGAAWRMTAPGGPPCLGLSSGVDLGRCGRRPCSRGGGAPQGLLYPEFQHRPPPPSYQASMQEYRLRLLLLDRDRQSGVVRGSSPPPTYRSHAGSLLRAPLTSTARGGGTGSSVGGSEYSFPPSYRSRNTTPGTISSDRSIEIEPSGRLLANEDIPEPLSVEQISEYSSLQQRRVGMI